MVTGLDECGDRRDNLMYLDLYKIAKHIATASTSLDAEDHMFEALSRVAKRAASLVNALSFTFYRYHPTAQSLKVCGIFWANRHISRSDSLSSFEWMEKASQAERMLSVAYQAIKYGEPVAYSTKKYSNIINSSTVLSPPEQLCPRGTHTLCVPIKIGLISWGVMETIKDVEFSADDLRKLKLVAAEFSAFVSATLLQKDYFARVATCINMEDIIPGICDIMLCEAGSIWIRQKVGEYYQCIAEHNRMRLRDSDGYVKLLDGSLKSPLIRTEFHSEEIGAHSSIFTSEWAAQPRNSDLSELGIRFITVIPIISNGSAIGSISLYGRQNRHTDTWLPLIRVIANTLRMNIESHYTKRQEADIFRRSIIHETSNTLPYFDGIVEEIIAIAEKADAAHRGRLPLLKNDYKQHYGEMVRCLDIDEEKYDLITRAYKNVDSNNTAFIDMANIIHSCTKPLRRRSKDRINIIWIEPKPQYVRVNVNRSDMHLLMRNIISNAAKYCLPKYRRNITIQIIPYMHTTSISISNAGDPIPPDEERRIYSLGWRSPRTENKTRGDGMGLYYVKNICKAYKWSIEYQKTEDKDGVNWNSFHIILPNNSIQIHW